MLEINKVYQGGCADFLNQLPEVDLLLTDPPYGINVSGEKINTVTKHGGKAFNRNYTRYAWDDNAPIELVKTFISLSKYSIVWGGNYFGLPPEQCWLVWDKDNNTSYFADCELAWTNLGGSVRLLKHLWNGMLRQGQETRYMHPTQKPEAVINFCLD
jgi:site-specific DNA-methyltransferase (adenine-specific)